ncbi:MAG: hypothetical protein U1E76_12275 [Planctomycetota bacterium]
MLARLAQRRLDAPPGEAGVVTRSTSTEDGGGVQRAAAMPAGWPSSPSDIVLGGADALLEERARRAIWLAWC